MSVYGDGEEVASKWNELFVLVLVTRR